MGPPLSPRIQDSYSSVGPNRHLGRRLPFCKLGPTVGLPVTIRANSSTWSTAGAPRMWPHSFSGRQVQLRNLLLPRLPGGEGATSEAPHFKPDTKINIHVASKPRLLSSLPPHSPQGDNTVRPSA